MMRPEDLIGAPVKVDRKGNRIRGKGKAWRWKIEIPASVTGTTRKRLYFKSEAEANRERSERNDSFHQVGSGAKVALANVGMTIEDAVAFAVQHAPVVTDMTMTILMENFLKHRSHEMRVTRRYLDNLRSYVGKIKATLGDVLIQNLTKSEIRKFLDGLRSKDGKRIAKTRTRNHYIETLRAILNFALSEGWLKKSPMDGIHTARTDDDVIQTLSINEVARLLEVLALPEHAEVAPAALLQIFAGPRRSELPYIEWEHLIGKYLRLDKVKRNTNKRPVEMSDNLIEWLAPCRQTSGFIFAPAGIDVDRECLHIEDPEVREKEIQKAARILEDGYTWRLNLAAKAAGIVIPKNALRHTSITMRVNFTQNLQGTALWAGNSPAVISSNYMGTGTPEDAKRYYSLKPQTSTVVAMDISTNASSAAGNSSETTLRAVV